LSSSCLSSFWPPLSERRSALTSGRRPRNGEFLPLKACADTSRQARIS
jgi:hypothetical protein